MPSPREKLASALGPIGFWTFQLDSQPAARAAELAAEVEALGFGAMWVPEGFGSKEAFSQAGHLLAATRQLVIATGIASIWARDPMAMSNGSRVLAEAYPGRFLLGMGVSHQIRAEGRGHHFDPRLLTKMRLYLDAMDEAPNPTGAPDPAPRVLAALGPRMLELARDRAQGAHPYFTPVAHTAEAREILGPDLFLAPEQLVVLEADPTKARDIGRAFMAGYLSLPNYANNLRRLGFSEEDMSPPYPDRFVDAVTAWGDETAIAARVQEHHDAGADHVCIQILGESAVDFPLEQLRRLALALLD